LSHPLKYRSTIALISTVALAAATLSACAPVIRYQGYTLQDANPATAVVGTDTKATIQTKYGTPTSMGAFDTNTWYYMSQTTDQFGAFAPRARKRDIIQINFDPASQKVTAIKSYSADEGRQIAYSRRETPTVGRQLSIWDQILSTIGGTKIPQTDVSPGSAPGQPTPR